MEVVDKSELHVVGIKIQAKWNNLWTEMPKAWQEFFDRLSSIQNRIGDTCIDISLSKVGDTYTQLICTEVNQNIAPPKGMCFETIPAQRYVHFRHEGPLARIAESFGRMYNWAKENNLGVDEFKLDVGYTSLGDEACHDLYVRIVEDLTS